MSGWTEERIEKPKRMWADKLPASQIGEAIGVTKNAVIGMRKRLDLPERRRGQPRRGEPPIPKKPQERKPQTFSGKRFLIPPSARPSPKLVKPQIVNEAPAPLMLDISSLTERTCKWPVTNDTPIKFCGHEKACGVPYCDFHRCRASARMMGQ
jgi:GcrA cell cycle regulator